MKKKKKSNGVKLQDLDNFTGSEDYAFGKSLAQ